MFRESFLSRHGRSNRVRCAREGDKKRVAFRSQLVAIMLRENAMQNQIVLLQDVMVAIAESIEELGRAFDIGEEKCDCPSWEFGHNESVQAGVTL
jgi:hypothetical protein